MGSAVRELRKALKGLRSRKTATRRTSASKLGALGDANAVEPLIAALNDEPYLQPAVAMAKALGEIGDPRAVDVLVSMTSSSRPPETRREAAEALAKIGDPRAVEPLITVLEAGLVCDAGAWADKAVANALAAAQAAAIALGDLKDPRCVEPLIAAIERFHSEAVTALCKVGDARAAGPLIAILEQGPKKSSAFERLTITRGLGDIGGSRAVTALVSILEGRVQRDDRKELGSVALEALGKIAARDGEALDEASATSATGALVGRLSGAPLAERRMAAIALVAMYRGGKLSDKTRLTILASKERITMGHQDSRHHKDGPHWDESTSWSASDCNVGGGSKHTDTMVTQPGALYKQRIDRWTHEDNGGIGVEFQP